MKRDPYRKFRIATASALALALAALSADSATLLKAGIWQGASITTSSEVIIGVGSVLPNPVKAISQFLYIEDAGASTICISFGAPATISGSTCSPGEITLQPGAFRFFDVEAPSDAVYAIGSGAGALTVGAQ